MCAFPIDSWVLSPGDCHWVGRSGGCGIFPETDWYLDFTEKKLWNLLQVSPLLRNGITFSCWMTRGSVPLRMACNLAKKVPLTTLGRAGGVRLNAQPGVLP